MTIKWSRQLSDVSSTQADWLMHRTSMTSRLRATCNNFSVTVLRHEWSVITLDEASMLQLVPHSPVIVREVVLLCDGISVMYARTIIPEKTAAAEGSGLVELGARPIGELLFSNPQITRSDFEFAIVPERDALMPDVINAEYSQVAFFHARRSCFHLPEKGDLAIVEVFLPGCWELKPCQKN